jgi:hypothetical protein
VASYSINERAVARARQLIDARQYVLDRDWGQAQPRAEAQNAFLAAHSWDDYAEWHLGLTDGAADQTKARYAFVYGDFCRLHRTGLIACVYRAAEWRTSRSNSRRSTSSSTWTASAAADSPSPSATTARDVIVSSTIRARPGHRRCPRQPWPQAAAGERTAACAGAAGR